MKRIDYMAAKTVRDYRRLIDQSYPTVAHTILCVNSSRILLKTTKRQDHFALLVSFIIPLCGSLGWKK